MCRLGLTLFVLILRKEELRENNAGPQVSEVIMQIPVGDNACPESDILRPELMSEEKETPLEKMKANGT